MICDASEYRTPCYFRLCPVSTTTSSNAAVTATNATSTSPVTSTTVTTSTSATVTIIKSKCNKINTCKVNCYCIGSNVNDANVNSSSSTNEFETTNTNNNNIINCNYNSSSNSSSSSCFGKIYYFNPSPLNQPPELVKSKEIDDAKVNYVHLNNGNMTNENEDDLNQLCHQLQHQARHSSIKLNINCLSNSFGLINNIFPFDFGYIGKGEKGSKKLMRDTSDKSEKKELKIFEKCSLNVSSPMVTTTTATTTTTAATARAQSASKSLKNEKTNELNSQNDIISIDLFARENAKAHRTSAYEIVHNPANPSLVIRRGDPFYLALRMRGIYDPSRDKIRLEFMYGPRPLLGKKTLIYLPVTTNREFTKDSSRWDARTHRVDGNIVTVQVHIPANVAVGVWRLRVSTKQQGSRLIKSFDARERIYVLFNAWCKEDPVYMENEDRRREYVLNDVGKIYIGSHSKPKGRKWIYGQFTDTVLPAVMFMLDKTRLDYTARANPVKVSRAVAAMVNSHDDNGVLVGNWSGSYESGTPPWQWTGSAPIMDQYLRTNGEPVKFGQCWVFAGVTTTVSKALGIPSRTVTNFVSAHDTDDSLTVDKFFDKSGETISDVNSDSIWNFHVWTDVWMTRFDLPPGYSGWQVIDSTPQETSDGLYRTGPASVESIRRGEIGLTYDSPFVFSEVNADVVHWELDERSEFGWKKIKTNKYHVGRKLFTKRIGYLDESPGGLNDAEDITHQYKNREGTEEERAAVLNAARKSGLSFLFELPFSSRN